MARIHRAPEHDSNAHPAPRHARRANHAAVRHRSAAARAQAAFLARWRWRASTASFPRSARPRGALGGALQARSYTGTWPQSGGRWEFGPKMSPASRVHLEGHQMPLASPPELVSGSNDHPHSHLPGPQLDVDWHGLEHVQQPLEVVQQGPAPERPSLPSPPSPHHPPRDARGSTITNHEDMPSPDLADRALVDACAAESSAYESTFSRAVERSVDERHERPLVERGGRGAGALVAARELRGITSPFYGGRGERRRWQRVAPSLSSRQVGTRRTATSRVRMASTAHTLF